MTNPFDDEKHDDYEKHEDDQMDNSVNPTPMPEPLFDEDEDYDAAP